MRKIGGSLGIVASFLLVLLAASGVAAWAQSNPVPFVNEPLAPGSAVPGGKSFTLTVNGTGFARGASVNWNASPLLTVVNNQGKLTATVPAADIATLGTAYVTVTNPGVAQASNTVPFPITQPSSTVAFAGSNVAALNSPVVLGVADFNGDGYLDIALQDSEGNIDVLLGHGDGTFSAPVVSAVNSGLVYEGGGVIAAFNGDGKLDIATAYVGIYYGNGDGTFTVGPQYPQAFSYGAAISAGDFNRDGYLDLAGVECGEESCSTSIFFGESGGTFQIGGGFFGGSITAVAVGDFNRDGKLDAAATDGYLDTYLLGVFLGNGDGSFQNGVDYGTAYADGVVTADFNGDGILDLAATDGGGNNVNIYLGKGDGTFGTATVYPTGSMPSLLLVGDFNGDGLPDLMASTYNYTLSVSTVSLLVGNGDGTFQSHVDYSLGTSGEVVGGTGDFNRDGKLDFVAADYYGSVSVFLQTAAALSTTGLTFGDQSIATTSPPQTVTLTNVGNSPMTISVITFTGANSGDFAQTNNCGTSLAAGASCTINVTFTPTATGTRSASLSITDSAVGSPQTVSLTGTGTQATVVLSPTSLTFGLVLIKNTSQPQSVMLTDTGNGSLAITNISTTGDFGQTNTCGSSVAAGRACTITVTFKPTAAGTRTGTLSITDNAPGSPQTIAITGTGTVVRFSGISVNFGNQAVGTTSPAVAVTLANIGTTPLAISHINIQGADAGDFAETNTCGSGVAAGGSCLIKLTFTPTAKGSRTASLGVSDNGGGSPQRVSLSGDGT